MGSLVRLALAASVGLVGPVVLASCAPSDEGGAGAASCAAVLVRDGAPYWGTDGLRRTPETTGQTLPAPLPHCDDSGGQDVSPDDEAVQVEELADVAPSVAVLFNDSIYVREGEELPAATRAWFRAPPCATSGTFEVIADWLGVSGQEKPRFDGDLRPPYRLEVRVTEGPESYVGATLTLRATTTTEPALSSSDVKASLWEGGQVEATLTCHDGRFDVVGITATGPPAPQP